MPEGGDEGVRPLLVSPRAGREDLRERGQSSKLMQRIIKIEALEASPSQPSPLTEDLKQPNLA